MAATPVPTARQRVEAMLAQDVVKAAVEALGKNTARSAPSAAGWDRILSGMREEAGEIDLNATLAGMLQRIEDGMGADTPGPPLPRLRIPKHLYALRDVLERLPRDRAA